MGVYIKGYNIEGLKDMLEHCGAEPYLLDVINMTRVPEPHGRLIDADFEEKHYASMTINPTPDVTPQDYMHSGYAAKAFQMAKTVIEAEERVMLQMDDKKNLRLIKEAEKAYENGEIVEAGEMLKEVVKSIDAFDIAMELSEGE